MPQATKLNSSSYAQTKWIPKKEKLWLKTFWKMSPIKWNSLRIFFCRVLFITVRINRVPIFFCGVPIQTTFSHQHFHIVIIFLDKMVVTFSLQMKSYSGFNYMRPVPQNFHRVLLNVYCINHCKKSDVYCADIQMKLLQLCFHMEQFTMVYKLVLVNFRLCGWNSMVWPFKWNLFIGIISGHSLLTTIKLF